MRQLLEVALPLRQPFSTASGVVDRRRIILVGITSQGVTGWGEAAPYPGVTTDTVEGVWDSIVGENTALTPSAMAALEEAEADLGARHRGQPLWAALGGSPRPSLASVAVGLGEEASEQVRSTGAGAVKLKIEPGNDTQLVRSLRDEFPDLVVGVDANGSYSWDDRDALIQLDSLNVAYVEQPFAADDLDAHAALRDEIVADVVVDEPIDSVQAAVGVIEAGAADVIAVKPGRIGIDACRVIHDLALAAGLRVKASGLIETAVGRAYALAVASLPGTVHSDLASDAWFFGMATGTPPGTVTNGWMTPSDAPGIGIDPDLSVLAPFVVRELLLDG
jgi:O-succinylbenzoate synthase